MVLSGNVSYLSILCVGIKFNFPREISLSYIQLLGGQLAKTKVYHSADKAYLFTMK